MLGAYALISAPLGFGLAATADQALPLLLGPRWADAAPFLSIVGPACALYAVYKLIVVTLQASGDARIAAFLSLAGAVSMVAITATLALGGHGAIAVAAGALVATTLLLASGIILLARKAEIRVLKLVTSVERPFVAATLMLLVLQAFDMREIEPLALLATKAWAGAALFIGAVGALWVGQGRPDGAEKIIFALLRQQFQTLLTDRFARM